MQYNTGNFPSAILCCGNDDNTVLLLPVILIIKKFLRTIEQEHISPETNFYLICTSLFETYVHVFSSEQLCSSR